MAMEAMLSEFDYFTPMVIQSAVVGEYDGVISPVNAINPTTSTGLNTLEFNIPGAPDLYRDLNNSYLMVKLKITQADGADLAADAKVAPVNLALHSLFNNASVTLCGKEISEKDTLYPYRAYLETLLTYNPNVLNTRMASEGWRKDDAAQMESLHLCSYWEWQYSEQWVRCARRACGRISSSCPARSPPCGSLPPALGPSSELWPNTEADTIGVSVPYYGSQ